MVLGLGTGSTAAFVVEGLAARVTAGLRIVGIPTSERTAAQARAARHSDRDLCRVSEARSDDRRRRRGRTRYPRSDQGPGRRLAARKDRRRGEPPAGHRRRRRKSSSTGSASTPRCRSRSPSSAGRRPRRRSPISAASRSGAAPPATAPYVTDGGNFILDCRFGPIADPAALEARIAMTVGTVESGLFVGRSSPWSSLPPAGSKS